MPWERDEADDRLTAVVIFAEAPYGPFDYLVPEALRESIAAGKRVRVPLGRGDRPTMGYCVAVRRAGEIKRDMASGSSPSPRSLKAMLTVVDANPLLPPSLIELTRWMADYYLCPWGLTIEGAVPAGVRDSASAPTPTWYALASDCQTRRSQMRLTPTQNRILDLVAGSTEMLTLSRLRESAGCTASPVKTLVSKGLLELRHERPAASATCSGHSPQASPWRLNEAQAKAVETIRESRARQQHAAMVLHGVTGSGKTEVYIRAIEETVAEGKQAIVLVPEISLTGQTRDRFLERFSRVAVLHSQLTDAERRKHWQRIAAGEVDVVVGARSAIFAPVPKLGLIVIDEEHDSSFKQDTAPRYHARDVARHRAEYENIPVILGSATPSLETWYEVQNGKYTLLSLPDRVSNQALPDVLLVDLRDARRAAGGQGAISRPLHDAMKEALAEGGQIILLMNRRGFSTNIQCPACGHAVRCPDCDVALTLHLSDGTIPPARGGGPPRQRPPMRGSIALCHQCNYQISAPSRCPECAFEGIRFAGMGTQRLEQEVRSLFPNTSLLRVDSDTMRQPGSHERAFAQFRAGEVRIMLGTQMIAKGLDFPNVTVVGVINADTALHMPDFRASERTFQLVTQVAGRSGRSHRGGRVIVQTFTPDHAAIQRAADHDFLRFAADELTHRQQFHFPPYSDLVRWIARGEIASQVLALADSFVASVRRHARNPDVAPPAPAPAQTPAIATSPSSVDTGPRILGPAPCPFPKIRGRYRYHVLLCGPKDGNIRELVRRAVAELQPPTGVQFQVDVGPWDMM